MKALTIWQPWASLIIAGVKPYEFRSWPAPEGAVGRRIAIHAGARPAKKGEIADLIARLRGPEPWTTALRPGALELLERAHTAPRSLVLSCVLGTAVLGQPVLGTSVVPEFGGPVNDSDRHKHATWAWPLTDIERFDEPVPAVGAQGFWIWRDAA